MEYAERDVEPIAVPGHLHASELAFSYLASVCLLSRVSVQGRAARFGTVGGDALEELVAALGYRIELGVEGRHCITRPALRS